MVVLCWFCVINDNSYNKSGDLKICARYCYVIFCLNIIVHVIYLIFVGLVLWHRNDYMIVLVPVKYSWKIKVKPCSTKTQQNTPMKVQILCVYLLQSHIIDGELPETKNQLWQLKRFPISYFTMDFGSCVRTWFTFWNDKWSVSTPLEHPYFWMGQ